MAVKIFKVEISNRRGKSYNVEDKRPLLDSLKEQGVDLPYGCKYGGCITYIILCVARPLSNLILEIGVESHDKLYRNPFLDPLKPHELKKDIATKEREK